MKRAQIFKGIINLSRNLDSLIEFAAKETQPKKKSSLMLRLMYGPGQAASMVAPNELKADALQEGSKHQLKTWAHDIAVGGVGGAGLLAGGAALADRFPKQTGKGLTKVARFISPKTRKTPRGLIEEGMITQARRETGNAIRDVARAKVGGRAGIKAAALLGASAGALGGHMVGAIRGIAGKGAGQIYDKYAEAGRKQKQ